MKKKINTDKIINIWTRILIDCGILLHPRKNRVILINEATYHYPYFNVDMVRTMMDYCITALLKGYTPHIMLKDRADGETNWDAFFQQPFNTTLTGNEPVWDITQKVYYGFYTHTPFSSHHTRRWCKIFNTLIRLNAKTEQHINTIQSQIIKPEWRILGVKSRGTDYVSSDYTGLPIQPTTEMLIKDAKLLMQEYHLDHIFLSTEDAEVVKKFETAFPQKVIKSDTIYYDDWYKKSGGKTLALREENETDSNYKKGLEYLTTLMLLSRCHVLLGGNCGGTQFALFMNNLKYEHVHIYNLGVS